MNDSFPTLTTGEEINGFVMTPSHPLWPIFCDRLAGPEGCDFRKHPTKGFTWKCAGGDDRSMATAILKDMGANVEASLAFFSKHDLTQKECYPSGEKMVE